jgi:hypothetical protein
MCVDVGPVPHGHTVRATAAGPVSPGVSPPGQASWSCRRTRREKGAGRVQGPDPSDVVALERVPQPVAERVMTATARGAGADVHGRVHHGTAEPFVVEAEHMPELVYGDQCGEAAAATSPERYRTAQPGAVSQECDATAPSATETHGQVGIPWRLPPKEDPDASAIPHPRRPIDRQRISARRGVVRDRASRPGGTSYHVRVRGRRRGQQHERGRD